MGFRTPHQSRRENRPSRQATGGISLLYQTSYSVIMNTDMQASNPVLLPLSGIRGAGRFTLISASDKLLLAQNKWYMDADGYAVSNSGGLHRYLLGPPRGLVVDHINGNRLDNRRENLRIVTQRQNALNRRHLAKNPLTCVKQRQSGWWWVEYQRERQRFSVGPFSTAEKASAAYREISLRLDGEYSPFSELAA
jgi:hypothetical protein